MRSVEMEGGSISPVTMATQSMVMDAVARARSKLVSSAQEDLQAQRTPAVGLSQRQSLSLPVGKLTNGAELC